MKGDVRLIENCQRRATRYAPELNKLEYQQRLEKLNLPTLQYRRFRGDMIEVFKILNKFYDEKCIDNFFSYKETNTRGHKFALKVVSFNANIRRNFFTNRVTIVWNGLPNFVVESDSINQFKAQLDRHCKHSANPPPPLF